VGILPLASPPAIDNAGDESAHFRNGMRRERVWRVRGEAELCAAWRRIRTITRAYLENVGSQFLSLQQDSIEHNKFAIRLSRDGLVTSVLRTNRVYSGRTPLRVAVGGTSMGTGLRKI
jgi:hypothetical protein